MKRTVLTLPFAALFLLILQGSKLRGAVGPQTPNEFITLKAPAYNAADGQVTITWTSTAGATYGVEASVDLKTPWTKIATGLVSDGTETSYTETLGGPRPEARFYRVVKSQFLFVQGNAESATITSAGGSVEVTATDGTHYALTIPEGAVLGEQEVLIGATPVSHIEGLPVSGEFLAALHLSPEGLTLFKPATLTITLAASVAPDALLGFTYKGMGEEFTFHPLFPGDINVASQTVILRLFGFSGYGVATGSGDDIAAHVLPGQTSGYYRQQIAESIAAHTTLDRGLSPAALLEIGETLSAWRTYVVLPGVLDAADVQQLGDGAREFLQWRSTIQAFWVDESSFASEIDSMKAAIRGKVDEFVEPLSRECGAEPSLCDRGRFLDEWFDLMNPIEELFGVLGFSDTPADINTFCDGLASQLPEKVEIEPKHQTVSSGEVFHLSAVVENRLGVLNLSPDQLATAGFHWSASPGGAVGGGDALSTHFVGRAVGEAPMTITLTAHACGCSDSALIEVTEELPLALMPAISTIELNCGGETVSSSSNGPFDTQTCERFADSPGPAEASSAWAIGETHMTPSRLEVWVQTRSFGPAFSVSATSTIVGQLRVTQTAPPPVPTDIVDLAVFTSGEVWPFGASAGSARLSLDGPLHTNTTLVLAPPNFDNRRVSAAIVPDGIYAFTMRVSCQTDPSPPASTFSGYLDPLVTFDQAAFNARMGPESYPLANYFELELSPNIAP